jgi:hypothetical protein
VSPNETGGSGPEAPFWHQSWHLFGTDGIRNLSTLQHRPSAWCLLGAARTILTDADSILLDPHRTKPHLRWSAFASPADPHRSDSFLVHFKAGVFLLRNSTAIRCRSFSLVGPALCCSPGVRRFRRVLRAWPEFLGSRRRVLSSPGHSGWQIASDCKAIWIRLARNSNASLRCRTMWIFGGRIWRDGASSDRQRPAGAKPCDLAEYGAWPLRSGPAPRRRLTSPQSRLEASRGSRPGSPAFAPILLLRDSGQCSSGNIGAVVDLIVAIAVQG